MKFGSKEHFEWLREHQGDEQVTSFVGIEPPEICPMGCGRTTEDVYGGPCKECWATAPRGSSR